MYLLYKQQKDNEVQSFYEGTDCYFNYYLCNYDTSKSFVHFPEKV